MASKAIMLLTVAATFALAGCIQSETTYESPSNDGCWMFCGGDSNEFEFFIWFPMLFVLLIVAVVVVVIVAANNNQQTVIIKEKEEKD